MIMITTMIMILHPRTISALPSFALFARWPLRTAHTLARPTKRKVEFPKRCVGQNAETERGKRSRTSVMPRRQNGRTAKRETAETDGTTSKGIKVQYKV